MGTIQPSRYLSHTGKILPGVRRVFTVPQPAADAGFNFTVPGGVQWWVLSAFFTLLTSATVANRSVDATVTVDGLQIGEFVSGFAQVASTTGVYGLQSTGGYTAASVTTNGVMISLPGGQLPEGTTVAVNATNLSAGDQFSACNLWIEETYVTDPQLSEIARTRQELDREIAAYEYEQAEQAGGNT